MGKVELLAPAGNYESFIGAVNAGADAIYLGGDKFGARAFAENFTTEQLCEAIRYAHLLKRKVYLTLNTLIKEKEFGELYDYLKPFYEAGLDGIIVQDMGVFSYVRRTFPHLPLHVSTQMTVTGVHAAKMLKEEGAVRIVPARELSLGEIREMKEKTGLEMETFIHGAMCYCYSGQCLLSSFLGGRSGNRGKCAQPCRLPYEVQKEGRHVSAGMVKNGGKQAAQEEHTAIETYPLSLKDMCTIAHIPDLIEAGIDSFKIEGRMKKPEYAAGVTSVYRKYIDLYYKKGRAGFQVSKEDMRLLETLYIRSEIQDGYYFRHNGKEMITLGGPGYSGSDDAILGKIRREYLEKTRKLPVRMQASFFKGSEAVLTLVSGNVYVTVTGQEVQQAMKQPVTEANIRDGLSALGETLFEAEAIEISAEEDIFYPLKAIKELRREGILRLQEALEQEQFPELAERTSSEKQATTQRPAIRDAGAAKKTFPRAVETVRVLVTRKEQLQAVLGCNNGIERLYLDGDICETWNDWQDIFSLLLPKKKSGAIREIYVTTPYILRRRDAGYLEQMAEVLNEADGCLVRNMEAYAFLREWNYPGKICGDASLYQWNKECRDFWADKLDGYCVPYELNAQGQNAVTEKGDWEQVVYGRIPMMVTANCVAKSSGNCLLQGKQTERDYRFSHSLKDRYRTEFPVYTNCSHCYNVIYNSVPLSLHDKVTEYAQRTAKTALRLDFTVENQEDTGKVLAYFGELCEKGRGNRPYENFTTGHEKKGAL